MPMKETKSAREVISDMVGKNQSFACVRLNLKKNELVKALSPPINQHNKICYLAL